MKNRDDRGDEQEREPARWDINGDGVVDLLFSGNGTPNDAYAIMGTR